MNVLSPSLAASLAKTLAPITDPAKTDASKSASPASSTGPTSASGSSQKPPGPQVAETLKDMSKALIALTLIQDPLERAKAAAHLYKQYSQVAKDYAAATADGRDAAAQTNAQNAATAAGEGADPLATTPRDAADQAADPAPELAAPPADAADAADAANPQAIVTDPAAETTATPMIFSGAKPRFVADLYMEEIKTFAGAAKQMYDSAVQEAKLKKLTDKSHKDTADEVEDAKKALTEAAKAVEGPDATDEVQLPSGASSSSPSASVLNIKA